MKISIRVEANGATKAAIAQQLRALAATLEHNP